MNLQEVMLEADMTKTMTPFRQLADKVKSGLDYEISDSWRQGRTAYGGLTAGLSVAAAMRDFSDLPPLRSAQVTFVGPVTETPRFETRLLRQGRNVTSVQVLGLMGDKVASTSTLMFGASRESIIQQALPMPESPPPEACKGFHPDEHLSFAPQFTRYFDMLLIEGDRPFTGSDRGYLRCWTRHKDPACWDGSDSFMCLGDVLPPSAFPMFTTMGPISSMNWQMNFLGDDVTTEDGWYQIETILNAATGGYCSQLMRFWNKKGDLIAEGMQSVAVFV